MRTHETVHSECSYVDDEPTYRVNFWEGDGTTAWKLQAFVLSDVDNVREALDWVKRHENGRPAELFVEMDNEEIHPFDTPRKTDLIRLYGANPNESLEQVTIGAYS